VKPDAALLDGLRRSRLLPLWARGSVGVGERRSTSKGSGMEFADYRAYRPGDDLRHLDPHLHARLGENFVRQYVVQRQLQVTILIDGSRSMSAGGGGRADLANGLAAVLGYVGLVGGDEVRYGFGRAGSIEWSPRFRGLSAASRAFAWLSRKRSDAGTFAGCLASASRALAQPGLVIVISDFWEDRHRARVYDHTWKLDPDRPQPARYGLLQAADAADDLGLYPKVDATFSLINRTTAVRSPTRSTRASCAPSSTMRARCASPRRR
jgi:uncharacterized protein (DUF58 family)